MVEYQKSSPLKFLVILLANEMTHKFRSTRSTHPTRTPKKLFILSTEGRRTEPQYFRILNNFAEAARTHSLNFSSTKVAPENLLNRINKYLKDNTLGENDETWIIVDRDNWPEDQLLKIHNWSQKAHSRGLALSNPKFEYWLLLHFEEGLRIRSATQIETRLQKSW